MFQRILVVCVGNICRSPIAEVMLRHHLPGVDVTSAGLHAMVGKPMAAAARAVLEARGYHPGQHAARQLEVDMLHAADLILVMEQAHAQTITRQAPQAVGRTFLLGKWQGAREVPDPYGQQRAVFERAGELIETGVRAWLPYLDGARSRPAPGPATVGG